jgi:hypothetical protein
MSESDEKPFTVNDRRHFTADGEARGTPAEHASSGRGGGAGEVPAEPAASREAPQPAASREVPRHPGGPVDFGSFLVSLGAQAGALLSGAGADEGMSAEDALAHAQQIVSILEMLQDKTQGRRTPDEDRLLEELLFQLRMAYVQKKQGGA